MSTGNFARQFWKLIIKQVDSIKGQRIKDFSTLLLHEIRPFPNLFSLIFIVTFYFVFFPMEYSLQNKPSKFSQLQQVCLFQGNSIFFLELFISNNPLYKNLNIFLIISQIRIKKTQENFKIKITSTLFLNSVINSKSTREQPLQQVLYKRLIHSSHDNGQVQ